MKRIFNGISIIALFAILCLPSCRKEYEFSHGIGLISKYNVLNVEAGNTPVLVFSNSTWTACFASEVDWAYIDRVSGTGNGQVKFYYEQNYGRSRAVDICFNGGGESTSIHMWQKAAIGDEDVIMTLSQLEEPASASASSYSVAFQTNLVYQVNQFTWEVIDSEGAPVSWVKDVKVNDDPLRKGNCTLEFSLEANASGEARSARLCICHTDGGGAFDSTGGTTLRSNYLEITQTGEQL